MTGSLISITNSDFNRDSDDIDDLGGSDSYEVDVEDEYLDKLSISSFNEDTLMDDFVSRLETIDGSKKSFYWSKDYKGVLIGIVRWNPDKSISHNSLGHLDFFNGCTKILCK